MTNLENLRGLGWHLTAEGLNKLCENEHTTDVRYITRKALDIDIRDIGDSIVTSEITKNIFGPVILQIVKLRNISAPKSKPNSQGAPRMLKLILTDGHSNCQAIEIKPLSFLTVDKTIPGTKILIHFAQVISGYILLTPENCKILGGTVLALAEKFELSKLMPNRQQNSEDGPPQWVNFGKKIIANNVAQPGFKSLENKNKDAIKENTEFQVQRQDLIAEAAQGAVKKVFGGGVKPPQTFNHQDTSNNQFNSYGNNQSQQRPVRQPKGKKERIELEKMEKPSQRVSLFDFLEDKLSLTENQSTKTTNSVPNSTNLNNKTFNSYNDSSKFTKPDFSEPQRYKSNNFSFQKPQINKFKPSQSNCNTTARPDSYNSNYFNAPRQESFNSNNFNTPRHESFNSNHFNTSRQESYNANAANTPYITNRSDIENRPQKAHNHEKFQNERPPRFQKQKPESAKFAEIKTKPNTNNFVDKLTSEINNISLYNSKYESEKLNKQPNNSAQGIGNHSKPWKWKVGDRCMAKYWEDDKYYNAVVTGITSRTCMVEFMEYGNFEEVLHCDCIPITSDKQERQHSDRLSNNDNQNQQFAGSLEFRRGKNRPFVRTPNSKSRNYES